MTKRKIQRAWWRIRPGVLRYQSFGSSWLLDAGIQEWEIAQNGDFGSGPRSCEEIKKSEAHCAIVTRGELKGNSGVRMPN